MSSKRRHQLVQGQKRERLSIEDCRNLVENCRLSDADLLRLRDQMYTAAEFAVSLAPDRGARESIEERAAIMEFDGGLSRTAAGRAAVGQYLRGIH